MRACAPDLPPEAWARVMGCLASARDVAGAAKCCRAARDAGRLAAAWGGSSSGALWRGRSGAAGAALTATVSSDGGAAAAALVSSAAVLAYDSWLHGVVSAPAERDTSDDAEARGDSVGPTPILDAEVDEWRKPRGRERVTRRELAALAPRLHQARGLRVLSLTGADASAHEVARAAAAARVPLVSLSLPRCGEWLRLARGSLVRALSGGQPLPRVFTPTARTNAQLLAALADLPTLRHLRLGSPCGAVYVASRKNTQRGFALGAHDSDESDSESDSDFLSTAAAGTGCCSSQGLGEKLADSREELLSASALLSTLTEGTLPQASAAVRGAQQPGVDVARAGQKSLFVEVFTPCVWHRQDESPPYSAAAVHLVFSHVSFATADPGEMKCGGPRLKSLFVQTAFDSPSPPLANAAGMVSTVLLEGSPRLPGVIHLPRSRALSSMPQAYSRPTDAALPSCVVEALVRREDRRAEGMEPFGADHVIDADDEGEVRGFHIHALGAISSN